MKTAVRIRSFILPIITALFSAGCVPGGATDTPVENDLDVDGIPDQFEQAGTTYLGLPLYDWGARINQTDIFIEIDYVDSTKAGQLPINEGVVPNEAALQKVVDAFASQGIAIHFDVGDLFEQSDDANVNPLRFDLGGGEQIDYVKTLTLDTVNKIYKPLYQAASRNDIFYYMVFGVSDAVENVLGTGFIKYPVSLITLGGINIQNETIILNTDTVEDRNLLVNMQSSVMMHELGHNLGLHHGGFEEDNFKPNYISVMNYVYTLPGIPDIGTADEPNRYYLQNANREDLAPPVNNDFCSSLYSVGFEDIANSPYSENFVVDYSYGINSSINESAIDETFGLGTGSGIAVDYNCDSIYDIDYAFDINNDSFNPGLKILADHNDWSNLYFYFHYHSSLGFLASLNDDVEPEIAREPRMPDWVLEKIRKRKPFH